MLYEYVFDNLKLCILLEDSAEQILKFYSDNKTYFEPYEIDKPDDFYTTKFQQRLITAEHNGFLQGNYVRFFMFDETFPDVIIGSVSFSNIKRGAFYSCQIGYKIDNAYQNQGYGYKMLEESIKIIINEYNIHRIEAFISLDNHASVALAKKLGFHNEGIACSYVKIKDKWVDHFQYAYIADN